MIWFVINQLLKSLFQCIYPCHKEIYSPIYFIICHTTFYNIKLFIFRSSFTATANETQPFFIVAVKSLYPQI